MGRKRVWRGSNGFREDNAPARQFVQPGCCLARIAVTTQTIGPAGVNTYENDVGILPKEPGDRHAVVRRDPSHTCQDRRGGQEPEPIPTGLPGTSAPLLSCLMLFGFPAFHWQARPPLRYCSERPLLSRPWFPYGTGGRQSQDISRLCHFPKIQPEAQVYVVHPHFPASPQGPPVPQRAHLRSATKPRGQTK